MLLSTVSAGISTTLRPVNAPWNDQWSLSRTASLADETRWETRSSLDVHRRGCNSTPNERVSKRSTRSVACIFVRHDLLDVNTNCYLLVAYSTRRENVSRSTAPFLRNWKFLLCTNDRSRFAIVAYTRVVAYSFLLQDDDAILVHTWTSAMK